MGGRKNKHRDPAQYTELMKSLGVILAKKELVMRYYRERALPYLIRFPGRRQPNTLEPFPEGEEIWDIGAAPQAIDWIASLSRSPYLIPGVTMVQPVYGEAPGSEPAVKPVNLYLGIDCSGSMPNPARQLSYPVLAGVIMALSALRAGAKVMAVLSGEPGEYSQTKDFSRREDEILGILTGYLGTGYAFGIERLRATFMSEKTIDEKTHVMIITDSDIFSMLNRGPDGWQVAAKALQTAGAGGTFVLHRVNPQRGEAQRLHKEGWDVFGLEAWESLLEFARQFSRKTYEKRS